MGSARRRTRGMSMPCACTRCRSRRCTCACPALPGSRCGGCVDRHAASVVVRKRRAETAAAARQRALYSNCSLTVLVRILLAVHLPNLALSRPRGRPRRPHFSAQRRVTWSTTACYESVRTCRALTSAASERRADETAVGTGSTRLLEQLVHELQLSRVARGTPA